MSKKDKKRKQKKRTSKRGVLPSSVQALLGYLGSGGPAPAPQGDTKIRERAGVDAYDTLHQIIKSQQLMSANYMANLERMAFQKDITEQLKKQGKESKKLLEETKQEVEKQVRQYTKSSTEEKLQKTEKKIVLQLSLKSGADPDKMASLEADKRRYEGMLQFETGMSANVALPKAPSVSAGGESFDPSPSGGAAARMRIAPAETAAAGRTGRSYLSAVMTDLGPQLPAQDPRAGGGAGAEISQGLEAFQSGEYVASSGAVEVPAASRGRRKKKT
jgi:hypothetical protein